MCNTLELLERCVDLEHVADVHCILCLEAIAAEAASKAENKVLGGR